MNKNKATSRLKKYLKEAMEILIILFIALLFRSVVYEPYVVPSESMLPTLIVGDRILVQKFSYGISRYSFPFSPPIFKGRIFDFNKPQRGDIAVFERDKLYIKRIIGLPGDKIQLIRGSLFINGSIVHSKDSGKLFNYDGVNFPEYSETLPQSNAKYSIIDTDMFAPFDNTNLYTVPSGHYFVMGDNRDNSNDSRNLANKNIGFIPYDNLLGKVETIFFSSKTVEWYNLKFLFNFNKDRFFKSVNNE